ncbi:MAG: MFS transporter [Nanoarchaeota archaeon]
MNRYLKILLLGSWVWYLGEGLFGPLYAIFAERIGGDILEITGAYSLYLISLGVLSIYIGKISDHHSKKKLMVIGYALNAIATFGYLLVDAPVKLFIVQGLLGLSAALASPTWDSLFSSHLDKKNKGEEWGFYEGGPKIIAGISLLVGGFILTKFSFQTLFIIMGTIQIVATIVQAQIYRLDKKY